MEELYLKIMTALAEGMPELSLIDEDYGQLETQEDTYPVTFPCALITMGDVRWNTYTDIVQRGDYTITVKLAIDCFDDTRYGSTVEDKIRERIDMSRKRDEILMKLEVNGGGLLLERESSRCYTMRGGIKIYETTFSGNLEEEC